MDIHLLTNGNALKTERNEADGQADKFNKFIEKIVEVFPLLVGMNWNLLSLMGL